MSLDWFPQPFGSGGLAAAGTDRLLGQPAMGLLELLIRESGQNSWDARLVDRVPEFGVDVRILHSDIVELLASTIFEQGMGVTTIGDTLTSPHVAVAEVHDRGTTGLDGPVRNDLEFEPGESPNFVNLIFNVGTDDKSGETGGTFGFGKSSAFRMSTARAVVYWTAVRKSSDEIEHRLIASSLGNAFALNGKRYSGRHWWGSVVDPGGPDRRVEPITGPYAAELGHRLFKREFGPGETGTSILIVGPDPGQLLADESDSDIQLTEDLLPDVRRRLRRLVARHLWPKLDIDGTGSRMHLRVGDELLTFADLVDSPEMTGLESLGSALGALRRYNRGETVEHDFGQQMLVMDMQRPRKLIGRVVVDISADTPTDVPGTSDGINDEDGSLPVFPPRSICLMRDDAELVVRYMSSQADVRLDGLTWRGVFKPASNVDHHFKDAEPPAHDDWNWQSMPKGSGKRFVKRAMTQLLPATAAALAPDTSTPPTAPRRSAVVLAQMLSDLAGPNGFATGSSARGSDPLTTSSGRRRSRTVRPLEVSSSAVPGSDELTMHRVVFELGGTWGPGHAVKIVAAIATGDRGRLSVDQSVDPQWSPAWNAMSSERGVLSATLSEAGHPANPNHWVDVSLPRDYSYAFTMEAI